MYDKQSAVEVARKLEQAARLMRMLARDFDTPVNRQSYSRSGQSAQVTAGDDNATVRDVQHLLRVAQARLKAF